MSVGSPLAGWYSSRLQMLQSWDTEQPIQVLLNHYCPHVKSFTCSHAWVIEDLTPYAGFDMALPSREENLLGLLEPFPSCLHFLTRIFFVPSWGLWHAQCAFVQLAGGWAFKGQEGLCWKSYQAVEDTACSSTTSSIPEIMKKYIIPGKQEKIQH